MTGPTRGEALATLRRLAAPLQTDDVEASASRLLERISLRDDAEELRAALVETGARAFVHPPIMILKDGAE
ncbi:MAG: hypothetical protein KJ067_23510 [Vicinamibacteria bacterium]|nr:hypothetical protein [Vicinamibacteria bacterium]